VFDVKRLIGRKFDDKYVQVLIKQWPFKVEAGAGEKPMIVVDDIKETKKFQKEEISTMAFVRMKEIAEAYFGKPVKDIYVEL
jgi:L1 cell adhesion molecule like protein